jgi:hypothetical protein
MKMLTTAIAGLAIALSAQVAQAYVVKVVTTVPATAVAGDADASQVADVVLSAIEDVVRHAIAFKPTLVQIDDARIIGTQLYLVLLIADESGQSIIDGLGTDPAASPPADAPADDHGDLTATPEPTRL